MQFALGLGTRVTSRMNLFDYSHDSNLNIVLAPDVNSITYGNFICREKELASVKINAADVELIVNELEVSFFLFFHH